MADPPGSTFIVEYSYIPPSPPPRRRPDHAPNQDETPTPTQQSSSLSATTTSSQPQSRNSGPTQHPLTFKMQADEVPREHQVADPHAHHVMRDSGNNTGTLPSEVYMPNHGPSRLIEQPEIVIPTAEATPVETTTIGFPPSPFAEQFRDKAFVSELEALQQEIRQLEQLSDCREMYRRAAFTNSLALIRSAQKEFMDANSSTLIHPTNIRATWAEKWAKTKNLTRSLATEWAWILDQCRKTSFSLVYKICDLAKEQDESLMILRDSKSYGIVLDTIVNLCLVMDRANCLFHMRDDASNITGLVWCRKDVHETLPQDMKNPRGSLMNKRLTWLFDKQVLSEQTMMMLKPLIETAFPPRLQSNSS